MKKIYLSPPHMSNNELSYIQRAFDENYIAPLGRNVNEFEEKIKKITKAKYALALVNATSAIHLALRVLGVGKKDIVLASSFNFIGSVAPILYQNATPVFIDSDKDWNIDVSLLEKSIKKLKKKPKALIVVHLYGQMAKIDKIKKICKKYHIALIEDGAESLGATFKNKQSGTFGDFGVYSFNGNKILTTSAGGVLVTNNKSFYEKAKFLSTQAKENKPHYEHKTYGYNYAMSNILAGIGIAQLDVLQERVLKKREIFQFYKNSLPEFEFMPEIKNSYGNRWLSTVLFKNFTQRENVRKALLAHNIESRPLWKPMHLQPLFKKSKSFTFFILNSSFTNPII